MKKTENPVVSVIVPVYNTETWLEECLDSIIRQTLHEIEIICVNDGSTDRSLEILEAMADADDRIRIICQENRGLSEARNTGVRAASGDYLYFMDSDDVLYPDALETCVENMIQRNLEFICFNMGAFGEEPETAKFAGRFNFNYFKRTLDDEKVYNGRELFAELKQKKTYIAPAQSCMLRRNAFLEHELWFHPGILHEDEPWMFAVLMSMTRCGCINRILNQYRIRNNSITQSTVSFAHVYGLFAGIQDAKEELQDLRDEPARKLLIEHIRGLQVKAAIKYRKCSAAEKRKREELDPEERFLFEQTIVYPATLANGYEALKKEIRATQQERDALKQEIKEKDRKIRKQEKEIGKRKKETATLKQEKKKLQRKIKRVEESETWRAGSVMTWLPGKTKKLLKKRLLKQDAKTGTVAAFRKNKIKVFSSEISGNRIVFRYSVFGEWSSCFRETNTFEIIYPFDLENVPESIRIIPFLSQVLPVSWIWDAEIKVPVCDQDFYDCIENVKAGYRKMYPMLHFDGKLTVESIEENKKPGDGQKALVCFSGGVDATNTTLSHLAEKPLLAGLWGADVPWENEDGWNKLESLLQGNADALNLELMTVRSSFRKLLHEGKLGKCVLDSGDDWYHGFQHGLGILGHMAPAAWHEGLETVYIASSNTEGTVYTCASDPTIDNFVQFCGTKVIHDGYETDRQEKILRITEFSREHGLQLPLHVCWEKRSGDNCCHCEKCWRTILGFYAAGADPKQYGFPLFDGFDGMSDDLERDFARFRVLTAVNYRPLQKKLQERAAEGDLPQGLSWFIHADLPAIEEGILMPHNGELVRPVWLLGTPEYSNLGDQCIAEEEIRFLQAVMPDRYVAEISEIELKEGHYSQLGGIGPSQPVFLQGGGNIGTIWPRPERIRREILRRLKDNPVVIFPQSIWFAEDDEGRKALAEAAEVYQGDNVLLCCRDNVSYQFAQEHFNCRSILVPDMALWEARRDFTLQERCGALTLLRNDKEYKLNDEDRKVIELYLAKRFRSLDVFDTLLKSDTITRKNRKEKTDSLIRRISSAECVVTDRLHGMILCAVTGTPCVAFPNGTSKLESGFEWLKGLDYIRFIHETEELAGAIDAVCSSTERIYPEKEMREQFGELVRYIHDAEA